MKGENTNMNTITYYKNGEIVETVRLDKNTVKNCHGMKIKCILSDGTEKAGFANTFYSFEKGGIAVGTEADMLEYLRWGGIPTNKFQ